MSASILWRGLSRRPEDSELAALRAGDEAAFQALVQRYHGPLMRVAMGYVRDRSTAEDVVQETWLTCLRSLDRFEGRSSLKTWIFGIALNVARARRRKDSRLLPFASLFKRDDSESSAPTVDPRRFAADGMWRTPPDDWSNVPESHVLSRETLDRVRSAIDRLPPRQREVIILRDVAGFDAQAVSTVLAITPENQRVRLHRARAAVRKVLEEYLR